MKFDSSLHLKWFNAADPRVRGLEISASGKCLFTAHDAQKHVTGLTVLETRDLNAAVFERLAKRMATPEYVESKFRLTAPPFLKHRIETLLAAHSECDIETRYTSFIKIRQADERFHVRDAIRVVSVDDSPVLLKFLKRCMDEIGYIDVLAQVSDSREAAATILKLKPDLVTMDIQMPERNGVSVVRELLAKEFYPVIMISSLSMEEGSLVFDALNSGAFDYLQKPKLEDKDTFKDELQSRILLALEARRAPISTFKPAAKKKSIDFPDDMLWCLGASTGGTQALTRVFTSMPERIPATLIVQHIPPVFSRAFAESLNNLCPFAVKEAEDGEPVLPNHVYIAAGGLQMGVEEKFGKLHIALRDAPPVNRFKPSVDYLFHEVAKLRGRRLVAGILTGMGRDGAEGLLALKKIGASTFAQDEQSSAVFGMPRVAIECGATDTVLPLDAIAETMLQQSMKTLKAG